MSMIPFHHSVLYLEIQGNNGGKDACVEMSHKTVIFVIFKIHLNMLVSFFNHL